MRGRSSGSVTVTKWKKKERERESDSEKRARRLREHTAHGYPKNARNLKPFVNPPLTLIILVKKIDKTYQTIKLMSLLVN